MTASSRPDASVPVDCRPVEPGPLLGRRPLLATGLVGAAGALTACGGSGGGNSLRRSISLQPGGLQRWGVGAKSRRACGCAGGRGGLGQGRGRSTVIVAQPKAGEAVAFSAKCTHMGCTVAPAGARLKCPCHGSVYDALTGKNISGPAPRPLPPFSVSVTGGEVAQAEGRQCLGWQGREQRLRTP